MDWMDSVQVHSSKSVHSHSSFVYPIASYCIFWLPNTVPSQPVFDYFKERTPRSYVEARETSLLWNYKYAGEPTASFFKQPVICWCLVWTKKLYVVSLDIEFGRVQARDMLQHLWTGPISNAAVDVVQGGRSVEVRPVGVSKVSQVI